MDLYCGSKYMHHPHPFTILTGSGEVKTEVCVGWLGQARPDFVRKASIDGD